MKKPGLNKWIIYYFTSIVSKNHKGSVDFVFSVSGMVEKNPA